MMSSSSLPCGMEKDRDRMEWKDRQGQGDRQGLALGTFCFLHLIPQLGQTSERENIKPQLDPAISIYNEYDYTSFYIYHAPFALCCLPLPACLPAVVVVGSEILSPSLASPPGSAPTIPAWPQPEKKVASEKERRKHRGGGGGDDDVVVGGKKSLSSPM